MERKAETSTIIRANVGLIRRCRWTKVHSHDEQIPVQPKDYYYFSTTSIARKHILSFVARLWYVANVNFPVADHTVAGHGSKNTRDFSSRAIDQPESPRSIYTRIELAQHDATAVTRASDHTPSRYYCRHYLLVYPFIRAQAIVSRASFRLFSRSPLTRVWDCRQHPYGP